MIALIQRVTHAQVQIESQTVGAIHRGVLALIGVRREDDTAAAERLLERVLAYRIFPDDTGRMNLSLRDIHGGLLLVPQFTLAADTHKGTRAGFSTAVKNFCATSPAISRSRFLVNVVASQTGSSGASPTNQRYRRL